jgi:hypothetical protein
MRIGLSLSIFATGALVGAGGVGVPWAISTMTGDSQAHSLTAVTRSGPRSPIELTEPAGEYWLQNTFSNLVLELPGDDTATEAGVAVQQWESLGAVDQRWRIDPVGTEGFVTITNVLSRKVLAVKEASTMDGYPVIQTDLAAGERSQQWALEDAGKGEVWIVNRHSGKVLDVPGNDIDKQNGIHIQQWQRQRQAKDQRWLVVRR